MMPESKPKESTKLFSQICEEADPEFRKEPKYGYRFSNGRMVEAEGIQGEEA